MYIIEVIFITLTKIEMISFTYIPVRGQIKEAARMDMDNYAQVSYTPVVIGYIMQILNS